MFALNTIKNRLLIISGIFLYACVGASVITSHEGLYLNSSENIYQGPPESIWEGLEGFSTAGEIDPGNTVEFGSKPVGVLVNTDCYQKRLTSFFPSIIIPLPPLIPLFSADIGSVNHIISVICCGCKSDGYQVEKIKVQGKVYQPSKDGCYYRFALQCKDIAQPSNIILKHGPTQKEIQLKYKKTYNVGCGWISL